MRLIDADAEIEKIEKEIKRTKAQIKEWEDNREDRGGHYNVDAKIERLKSNINQARVEIACLKKYSTAYDVDKVVEQIRKMEICGSCLNNQNPIPVCATFCDVGKKLEIVKAGEINEKEN